MHTQWQTFLASQGGTPTDDGGIAFPEMPIESDRALCALADLGVIGIDGADASDFLQGQLSNDVRELSAEHCQLSSHCNAKGRMLANFLVLQDAQGYRLILPRELIAPVLARLRLFVLRAQVRLTDLSDQQVCIGLLGDGQRAALTGDFPTPPDSIHGVAGMAGGHLIRLPGPLPRWLFVGEPAAAESLWQRALAQGGQRAGTALWALQDIRAGIPVVRAATSELFVPQMANMHLIDGLSFHKGCYTGQEVVARMQYLGKLKRRMYYAEAPLATAPAAGTRLESAGSQSAQGAGTLVDARSNAAGGCELLAVAEIAAAERADLTLAGTATHIHLQPPPYGFPPAV